MAQPQPTVRADVEKLRRVSRASVTRSANKLNEILNDAVIDRPTKIFQLKVKLEDFRRALAKLEDVDNQLFLVTDDDDLDDEIDAVNRLYDTHHVTRDNVIYNLTILELEEAAAYALAPAINPNPGVHAQAANSGNPAVVAANITPLDSSNLPKFNLPEFNGDILKWKAFWDVFETEVHLKTKFSDATKFNFLNSRLSGEAKSLLAGLTPNNQNYPKALALLTERYNQTSKIINAHMRALIALAKPSTDRSGLRKFSDNLESHIRGLEALGKETDSYGDLLVCLLLDKLSPELRRNLNRQHGKIDLNLEELREALKLEIEMLEDSQKGAKQPSGKQANVLHVGATSNISSTQAKFCALCSGNDHSPNNCLKFPPESRLKEVQTKKLCLNCLKSNHFVAECRSSYRCYTCKKKHHSCLHFSFPENGSATIAMVTVSSVQTSVMTVNASDSSDTGRYVFLETAVIKVDYRENLFCNALVDKCAQRTLVVSKLVKILNLKTIRRELLTIVGVGSKDAQTKLYDVVQIPLVDKDGQVFKIQAVVVDNLVKPIEDPYRDQLVKLPYLKNLKLAHPPTGSKIFKVDLLIGSNYYWSLVGDEIIRGSGPTAMNSRLGYLISGEISCEGPSIQHDVHTLVVTVTEEVDLTRFWDLEQLGINSSSITNKCSSYFRDGITFSDGKYVARLPWKEIYPELASNYGVSRRRTWSTINRLEKKQSNLVLFDNIIREQLSNKFIEIVPDEEIHNKRAHYVPMFAVVKDSETTPIRIVYDCSCKSADGVSLNDCLEAGPPLQKNMLDILLRFRTHRIGISSDISKAFHQIMLHPEDRDFVRFFWIKDLNHKPYELQTLRFRVIPFGATCSPFILLTVLQTHLSRINNSISIDMDKNIYVDNLITGCEERDEAISLYQSANAIMQDAGLNLQSWGSNCEEINRYASKDGISSKSSDIKVLGIKWSFETDTLSLPEYFFSLGVDSTVTKRSILKDVSSVYDPLGFWSPLTISAKILLQEIWKRNFTWDENLPLEFKQRWLAIASSINQAKLEINRSHFGSKNQIHEVHIFVDASQVAFGAVAYFRNSNSISFVMSKARVAPVKGERTLPQLELVAAVIGTRLADTIQNALTPLGLQLRFNFWSDSQIVLFWLSKEVSTIKCQFVNNRINEIRSFNQRFNPTWRYCPTASNPADLLTRGLNYNRFQASSMWFNGPPWLTSENKWPVWTSKPDIATIALSHVSAEVPLQTNPSKGIENILQPTRYNWTYLLRVTAALLRLHNNICLKDRTRHQWKSGFLTANEINQAEVVWMQSTQKKHFLIEYEYLVTGRGKRPPLVSQLDLFLSEDDLIRCRGRLQHASIIYSAKHPVLLPKTSPITSMIVEAHHIRTLHGGEKLTVTSIRQRYWIPQIRQAVKSVIRRCVLCKRSCGPPYSAPNHAPLPSARVKDIEPFSVVGVDYTGAFTLRGNKQNPKVDQIVYILLFTCPSSRAIHLEVVEDLSTLSFIQAFRCFTAHHSLPRIIMSDNATTFESAAKAFKNIFLDPAVHKYLSDRRINWQFIPKRAPWYGGYWERMVGIAKNSLKKMLGRSKPTLAEFRALIAETEAVLNDRPLEEPSSNFQDGESLTPSHLLYGKRNFSLPASDLLTEEICDPTHGEKPSEFRKAWQRHQKIINTFRKAFLSSYLPALREHHAKTKAKTPTIVEKGDVVMIHDEGPRNRWKMAVVDQLINGKDGEIRAVNLRTAKGSTNRAISKLYPIGMSEPANQESRHFSSQPVRVRPKRKAAKEANIRLKTILEE